MKISSLCTFITLSTGLFATSVSAQSIISANDGTETIVNQNGFIFNITGGIEANNNLFHSFQTFGLDTNQIANFLSNPNINNILGRVTGGNPSIINGLIQITGGNSNLYLINPAGIIFGNNFSLNVPADFTATTATAIEFNNNWFNAFGNNNYEELIGNPTAFAFNTNTPGTIINTGDLINNNGDLTLVGGTVISTGNLNANGNLNIKTVPGSSKVILSQSNNILTLEIDVPTDNLGNSINITPLNLPELLTGNNEVIDDQQITNNSGNVSLTSSEIFIEKGDIALTSVNPITSTNNINLFANNDITLTESQIEANQNINLLAQDTIYIRDSIANPIIITSGNNTTIQGNQGIDILTLNHLEQTPFVSGGDLTFISDGIISGDAHFESGGNTSFLNLEEDGGNFISLYDPIISATGDVTFGSYTGASLQVEATGNINITGDVVINAIDPILDPNNYVLILQAGVPILTATNSGTPPADLSINTPATTPSTVTVGNIDVGNTSSGRYGGIVTIEATGDIQTGDIITYETLESIFEGGDVTITSTGGNITTGNINTSSSEFIQSNSEFTQGGDVTITSTQGNVITGSIESTISISITNPAFFEGLVNSRGGNITITHSGGANNNNFTIGDPSINGTAGDIITGTGGTVNTLSSGLFPVLENGGTATGTPSGITIVSVNTPPIVTISNTLGTITEGNSITANYSDLGISISDNDLDNTNLIVDFNSINGILTINGDTVTDDTVISEDAIFGFTPSPNLSGNITAFSVKASDNVSFSDLVNINITIENQPVITMESNNDTNNINTDFFNLSYESLEVDRENNINNNSIVSGFTALIDILQFESNVQNDLSDYLGLDITNTNTINSQQRLRDIENATNIKPAILYAFFLPSSNIENTTENQNKGFNKDLASFSQDNIIWQFRPNHTSAFVGQNKSTDYIQLTLITPSGNIIEKKFPEITREKIMIKKNKLISGVTDTRRKTAYLTPASELYDILIAPLEAELENQDIDNIAFILDEGLRSLPIAALYDQETQQHLIEKYSLGLMPSFSLTNTEYVDISHSRILTMGSDKFENPNNEQNPLPAVPTELSMITEQIWQGDGDLFLNESFTVNHLQNLRDNEVPYGVLHLATHGEFTSGSVDNSYIQFWDEKLALNQIRNFHLNNPPVGLLVLSACRTAIGDRNAELGFAGLAVASGVKSALGSLWYVSDQGTLAFMTNFYNELRNFPIKTEAIRKSQLDMLYGNTYYENGKLITPSGSIELPDYLAQQGEPNLSHPYYWSAFSIIGNPY